MAEYVVQDKAHRDTLTLSNYTWKEFQEIFENIEQYTLKLCDRLLPE